MSCGVAEVPNQWAAQILQVHQFPPIDPEVTVGSLKELKEGSVRPVYCQRLWILSHQLMPYFTSWTKGAVRKKEGEGKKVISSLSNLLFGGAVGTALGLNPVKREEEKSRKEWTNQMADCSKVAIMSRS